MDDVNTSKAGLSTNIATMPQFTIGGINVEFPKTPYPCQIQYMEHVIRALSTGSNALLESPTGTGKTLCLLCATLAWQQSRKPKSMELAYSEGQSIDIGLGSVKTSVVPGEKKNAPHTIVYATRTHSQLAQVVSELRETAYRPRMTVLGSREQLCVHEKVSKLKNGVINHACNSLNSKRGCMYRNNLDNYIESTSSMDNTSMMDIEEMVKLGTHRKICPYFHSREFCASSDIVLLPYNYLLDGAIRNTVKVDWSNAIIIFDEAHNLERVSADAASFSLSSTDLALCIQEMQHVLATLRDEQQRVKAPTETEALQKLINPANPAGAGQEKPSLAAAVALLKAMFELERRIDGLQMTPSTVQQQNLPGIVYPGVWLPDLLKTVGFTDMMHVVELKKCCSMLMEMAQDALGFDASGASAAAVEPKLQAFTSSLARVLHSVKSRSCEDYKVYISDEAIKQPSGSYAAEGRPVQKKRVINYWCFSTGVAMQELQQLGVKSLLLTSGTLSPMGALKEDIKLPFPIQLENPHVIGDNQMWVAALPTGVSGKALNSSFQSRDTNAYKDELGLSVLQICNTMIGGASPAPAPRALPSGWAAYGVTTLAAASAAPAPRVRGGVLIFFPSYAVMENVAARWKETGVHDKLRNSVGSVLMEPKGAGISNSGGAPGSGSENRAKKSSVGFHSGRDQNSNAEGNFMLSGGVTRKPKVLDDEDGENSEEFRTIVGQFEHAIKANGGCVLLAVCRGKVSEGIDFTDNKGRVVIITGIPFAPYMDPWVVLKKQYLDDKSAGKLYSASPLTALTAADPGPVLNLAAFQRPVAPSAYPVVMGPPAVPIAPTASAAGQGYGGGSVPAAPPVPPSGYGPHGSGLVNVTASGYGAPSAQSAPTKKVATPSQSLSGQGWYSQTAGRAVNQCIGRVIRHNRDWGTVFLLDDRFMNDRQIAQLSGWVKPRVKKFTSFESALKGFRAFITVAAQDKSLVSQSAAQRALEPAPDIERFRRREASDKPKEATFTRQVEIHESELAGAGEDNTFINPSFLLTQSSAPVAERDTEKDMMSFFRKASGSSSVSASQVSVAVPQASDAGKGGTLLDAFSRSRDKSNPTPVSTEASLRMERAESQQTAIPFVTISYSSAPGGLVRALTAPTAATTSAKSVSAGVTFGLGATAKPTSFFVPEKVVRTKDSTIADYFAPPKPVPQTAAAEHRPQSSQSKSTIARPSAVVRKSGLDIPKFSQGGSGANYDREQPEGTQSQSFLNYLSKLDDEINSVPDAVTEFHSQIAVLKGLLPKDKLLALKSKLMLAKGSVMSTFAHVKHFLASVVTILDGVDAKIKYKALLSFACMLPSDLSHDYTILVSETVDSGGQKSKTVGLSLGKFAADSSSSAAARDTSLSEGTKRRFDEASYSQSQTQSQSSYLTQDVKLEGGQLRSAPSKRAKLMLSASLASRSDGVSTIKTEPGASKLLSNAASSTVKGNSALSFLSKLSNLDSIALTGAVKTSNSSENRSNRVGSANLACTVCKEQPATDPCAARCGHVCCQICWTKWLKVNQSCPQCRQPADVNSVTRIVVKR